VLRKSLLAVTFTLLTITPCYAQEDIGKVVNDAVSSAFGSFFGGSGELPVKESSLRRTEAAELLKIIAQLEDMLFNSQEGPSPGDDGTGPLIHEITELSEDGYAHGYGGDLGSKWNDAHAMTHVFPEGGWLRNEIDRGKRSVLTQRMVMEMLQARKEQWEENEQTLRDSTDAITSAEGRNATLKAIGGGIAVGNWQQQATQAVIMAGVNAQAVHYAQEENEKMAQTAQQYYFLSNGGTPEEGGGRVPSYPQFGDVGLR